jgi:hypothetical protein
LYTSSRIPPGFGPAFRCKSVASCVGIRAFHCNLPAGRQVGCMFSTATILSALKSCPLFVSCNYRMAEKL